MAARTDGGAARAEPGRVTAAAVARAAGCSPAAVTRAFQTGSAISDELRLRVLDHAAQLGFQPPAQRALARLAGGTITLVAGDLLNPFYAALAGALALAIHRRGLQMILHVVPPGDTVDAVLDHVLAQHSTAAIVASSMMPSRLARICQARGMPVVNVNRVQADAALDAVTSDNHGGGRMAAARFLDTGRTRFAALRGLARTSTDIERMAGFRAALAEAGAPPPLAIEGRFDYDTAFAAVTRLSEAPRPPDALFCVNDVMALGALDALRRAGMHVPEDMAVIGFDDIPMAAWEGYRLTTLRQPIDALVCETLSMLDERLAAARDDAPITAGARVRGRIRVLPVTLIARATA